MTTRRRAVVNRLTGAAASLESLNETGLWQVSAISGSYEKIEFQHSEFSSVTTNKQIKITGVSASPSGVEVSFDELFLEEYDDQRFIELVFFARIDGGGSIQVVMTDTVAASVSEVETNFTVPPVVDVPISLGLANPSWRAYRANPIRVEKGSLSTPRITATITFKPNNSNSAVYFAGPAIYGYSDHFAFSQAAQQISVSAPDHLFNDDYENTTPPNSLTRFVDVSFTGLDQAIKAMFAYRFRTVEEARDENDPETLSELVWPENAPLNEAEWLAQFSGTEPVAKLSSTLDPSDAFILDSSELNGTDTLRFSTTGVNDPPLGTLEVTRDFLRWQAKYGYYGMNSGSVAAIRESVKRVMVEPKNVSITLQHDGPFTVLVRTPWEQTYGASPEEIGLSSQVVLEAVARAKPIGVKVVHELT